jgi:dUTP pyrophosphatase
MSIFSLGTYTFGHEHPLPEYATEHSACFDLRFQFSESSVKCWNEYNVQSNAIIQDGKYLTIPAGSRALIPTGMIFDLRPGMSMRVHPRSGLALKQGLTLINAEGVIDADYRQQLYIPLYNVTRMAASLKVGERIAQGEVLIEGISVFPIRFFRLPEAPEPLSSKTSRTGGFGSTGTS